MARIHVFQNRCCRRGTKIWLNEVDFAKPTISCHYQIQKYREILFLDLDEYLVLELHVAIFSMTWFINFALFWLKMRTISLIPVASNNPLFTWNWRYTDKFDEGVKTHMDVRHYFSIYDLNATALQKTKLKTYSYFHYLIASLLNMVIIWSLVHKFLDQQVWRASVVAYTWKYYFWSLQKKILQLWLHKDVISQKFMNSKKVFSMNTGTGVFYSLAMKSLTDTGGIPFKC